MRALWTHNLDPDVPHNRGFMNTMYSDLRKRGVDVHFAYLGNLRSVSSLLAARRRLQRLAVDFDLVHAQYGSACALATAAVDGIPKVLTIRGSDWNVHNASRGLRGVHNRLARGMTRWSLDRFDCVLTVSHRMGNEVKRLSPGSLVVAMPSPIDLSRFVPRDKQEARTQLGEAGCREKWVLFNALELHDPNKRFALARRAVDVARAKRGDVRLRVATDLPHAELPLFTAACDLILCTSKMEGWPNCVKEALACNVPFVSTDVSDLQDIARREPTCRVCEADPVVLGESICEVLASRQQSDLRRHVTALGLDATSDRLVSVYESVLSGSPTAEGVRSGPRTASASPGVS